MKSGLPEALRAAVEDQREEFAFRLSVVECLAGCPTPCAVAFDAPEKWRVRLTRLSLGHTADIIAAASAYFASEDGFLNDADLPEALRGHVSARSPKRAGIRERVLPAGPVPA